MKSFNWENAEKALDFAIRRSAWIDGGPTITVDELLENAKKIYDFLCGDSHHFTEATGAEEPK